MLKIPTKTEYVINRLHQNGFEAYIVGGCVRDMLLNAEPHDFDVTTSAEPQEVMSLFEKTVPTGVKHGTVTVLVDSTPIEVTTFRTDGTYTDSRRPDNVVFVKSLKEDLARRDFTVNAMAYSHTSGLVDYFGGQEDLKAALLRAVGEPEKRFKEDALRILRLFRFASVLNFTFEEKTLAASLKCSPALEDISRERILNELSKAVCGKNVNALSPLIKCGGLGFLGISKCPDFNVLQKFSEKPFIAFFGFLHLSGADVIKTLSLLKASNLLKNYCANLLTLLSFSIPKTKSDLKGMLAISSPEILDDYLLFISAVSDFDTAHLKIMLNEIISLNEPYLVSHLKIDGKQLEKLGYSGKEIGRLLSKLQKAVIKDSSLNSYEKLLEFIKKAP